jgi:hypothetical protein
MTASGRWRAAGWLSALLVGAVPLILALTGVSLVVVASESVAYRYFIDLRLLRGEPGLFVPQGHSVGAIQHLIIWAQQAVLGIPPQRLRATLDTFGYLTLAISWACTAAVLVMAFSSRRLDGGEKSAIGAVALGAVYASASGISMVMMPDYYGFETAITVSALAASMFAWHREWTKPAWRAATAIGLFGGLALATKVTLVMTGSLPMLVVLAKSTASIKTRFADAIVFAVASLISGLLIVAAAYRFDWSIVVRSIDPWLSFVRNAGSEPNFWASVFWPFTTGGEAGANYLYALVLLPVLGGLATIAVARTIAAGQVRAAILGSLVLAAMALHFWALFRRPAGTTLWEITLFWSAGTALTSCVMTRDRWRRGAQAAFVAVMLVVCTASTAVNLPRLVPLRVLRQSTMQIWEAHSFLHRGDGEKVVVIPDNRYAIGSVEEVLMKGTSDFPSWTITSGQTVLDEVVPRLRFRQQLEELSSGAAVMWIDIPDEQRLTDRFPALARRAAKARCRNWDVATWPWWPRRIVVCPPVA